jgi:hypothetical protein
MTHGWAVVVLAAALLHGCSQLPDRSGDTRNNVTTATLPSLAGAQIEPSGFATISTAPPRPLPDQPPAAPQPQPTDRLYAERMANPDEAVMGRAFALQRRLQARERGNFVQMIIVRDPKPRYAIYFRRNAAATLAKYTRDPNFKPVDGGIPDAELRPIFDEWGKKFTAVGIAWGGGTQAYQGLIEFDIDMHRSQFDRIAAERRWAMPDMLKLKFAPELTPMADIPGDIAPFIRAFPRVPSWTRAVNAIGLSGRLVLRDGCFRLIDGTESYMGLAVFARNAMLFRDAQGYLSVGTANDGNALRVGHRFMFGISNPGEESDPEIRALRAKCGNDPLVGVGVPRNDGIEAFQLDRSAEARGLSREVAWERIRDCWIRQPNNRSMPPPGEQIVWSECEYALGRIPESPPPPPSR